MQVIKCANIKEVKDSIVKALEKPETTIIKINGKNMATINNCPNEIYDIFYLPILPKEDEELDFSKRIENVAKYYSLQQDNADYVLKLKHGIASSLVDKVIVKNIERLYKNRKNEVITDCIKEWNNWFDFVQYVNNYLDYKEPDLIFTNCQAEVHVGDIKFDAVFSSPLQKDDGLLVHTKTKLKNHCFFKDCMTALDMCKYLIHCNISDVYDDFTTDVSVGKAIYEYDEPAVHMTVYECDKGIYVEIIRGMLSRDVMQLVFIDNAYVRENIEKAHLIDINFIGLHKDYKFNKELYDYIKQNDKIEKEAKEKILRLTAQDLRMIIHTEPEIEDGRMVFSVGGHKIRFNPKHSEWINEMKSMFKFAN
ncbi:MAG: hypothetical protein RMJ67_09420 [Elusimicrobiota bacterium]|nr:hypothetical protein [Endomicrobiia bacterium]MDW8166716.1 hypothetical protein [Elusimicrobiota bacterium]